MNDLSNEMYQNKESYGRNEEVRSLVNKLNEKSAGELSDIINRYIDYRPETVDAALFLLVEKGIITYELKEKLSEQIKSNFSDHKKPYIKHKWEANNAFIQFVSRYNDDEIYEIIEDPKGIVLDAYHAILITAKERELISEEDFRELYAEATSVPKTRTQIRNELIDETFKEIFIDREVVTETELNSETEKYWICPTCGQLVVMGIDICWKCQTRIPETVEHPDKEAIKQIVKTKKAFTPIRLGLVLSGCGTILVLLVLARGYSFSNFWHFRYAEFLFGTIFILAGIGTLIYGLFLYLKKRHGKIR